MLLDTAVECEGFSGRSIRKLPFQTFAFFGKNETKPLEIKRLLCLLKLAAEHERDAKEIFHEPTQAKGETKGCAPQGAQHC